MNTKISSKISVILGSYNRGQFLPLTITSVRQELKETLYEIIVVDGGSDDGSLQWLQQQKDILTIIQHNRGVWKGKEIKRRSWGYFMNLAFKCAQGKFVCMLSDDCILIPGAIKNGINHAEKQMKLGCKVGAVAFYFRDWSREEDYHVGYTLGENMYVNHGLYLRKAVNEVNYVDEDNFFFYNADGDLSLKIWKKGYSVIDSPNSYVEHYPYANIPIRKTNYKKFKQDLDRYLDKWEGIFYDRKKNNLGKIISKKFKDPLLTGDLFLQMHKQIELNNPQFFKKKSIIKRAAEGLKWKYQSLKRRISYFFFLF
jgi:glycosyltransferase involved in cell wall biosynthesis